MTTSSSTTCERQVCALTEDDQREMRPCVREAGHNGVCRYKPMDPAHTEECENHDSRELSGVHICRVIDPTGWEEDEDYDRRVELGLRPIAYAQNRPHPDTRSCPTWCQMVDLPGEHGIKEHGPLEANHVSDKIETLASIYKGQERVGDDGFLLVGSTIETFLTRRGADATLVRVLLNVTGEEVPRRLTLTLDDAADLVTAMQHVIAQADAHDLLAQQKFERNAFEIGRDYERFQDAR